MKSLLYHSFMKGETIHVYFWCWFGDFIMVVYEDWLILTLSNYMIRGSKFIGSIVSVKGLQMSVSESWTAQSWCLTSRETKTFKSDTLHCTAQIETRIRNDTTRDEVWKKLRHNHSMTVWAKHCVSLKALICLVCFAQCNLASSQTSWL